MQEQNFLHPIAWIFYSGTFFWIVIKIFKPAKVIFYLKCYCIFMMPLAIEALVRSMMYVNDIWSDDKGDIILIFLSLSIVILLFCVLTLNKKFARLVTHNIYIFHTLILIAMIVIYPKVSVLFEASLQILSVWGCIAMALFYVSIISKNVAMSDKPRNFIKTVLFSLILSLWILFLIYSQGTNKGKPWYLSSFISAVRDYYMEQHIIDRNEALLKFSPTETVDMTDIIVSYRRSISESKFIRTGAVSILLRNKTFVFKHDIEAWINCIRGVPSLGLGAYSKISVEDYKKRIVGLKYTFNSPNLDSSYDGTESVFFRVCYKPYELR